MPNREQLQSLLGRVETATGPDSLLDTEIAIALGHAPRSDYWTATAVTASVDAALALVERVLPGHAISVGTYQQGPWVPSPWARLSREGHWTTPGGGHWTAHGASIPLAILTALLSALISESKPKQETRSTEEGT